MKIGDKSVNDAFPDKRVAQLVRAASRGDLEEVRLLVDDGADVNYVGLDGITPIIWVMAMRNKEGSKLLLELGADPNKKMNNQDSATWLAAGGDDLEMLELVLKNGGDPNIRGRSDTAIQNAIGQLRFDNVKLLMKYGADINLADRVGRTAAVKACAQGQFNMVAYFLDKGYSYDLVRLKDCMLRRSFIKGSEQEKWRSVILERLRKVKVPD